jgi:hypothetical protein
LTFYYSNLHLFYYLQAIINTQTFYLQPLRQHLLNKIFKETYTKYKGVWKCGNGGFSKCFLFGNVLK